MEIQVDLTRDDFINFNKYYYFKKTFKKSIVLIIIIIFLGPLLININKPFDLAEYFIFVVIMAGIWGSIFIGFTLLSLKRIGKLPLDEGSILGKKKYIIADKGFIEESEMNKSLRKWAAIKAIETNKNYIFIFVDTIAAYVIPKRSFKNADEMQAFLDAINEKTRNAA